MKELKKNFPKLTKFQEEVIIGTLLGNAHARTYTKSRATYLLSYCQTWWNCDYLFHLYYIFSDYCGSFPHFGIKDRAWFFRTTASEIFTFYGKYFYDSEGKKRIPKDIQRYLTSVALAYWYMDNGSIKSKNSKAVVFNTHGYMLEEVELLCKVLKEKFDLDAKPQKQRDRYIIYISGHSYEKFVSIVDPYILATMRYKIPPSRKSV